MSDFNDIPMRDQLEANGVGYKWWAHHPSGLDAVSIFLIRYTGDLSATSEIESHYFYEGQWVKYPSAGVVRSFFDITGSMLLHDDIARREADLVVRLIHHALEQT